MVKSKMYSEELGHLLMIRSKTWMSLEEAKLEIHSQKIQFERLFGFFNLQKMSLRHFRGAGWDDHQWPNCQLTVQQI